MIGNGKWHKLIPKDPEENLRYRKTILEACAKDADVRAGVMAICQQDILFWINTFCIGKGTLVLTDRGNVPIEQVTSRDKVWDGDDWVKQDGPVFQGCKSVIFKYEIFLTPDHKVWTIHGWQDASHGHCREEVRFPYGDSSRRILPPSTDVGCVALPVRLRKREDDIGRLIKGRPKSKLRMLAEKKADARDEPFQDVRCVERDAVEMRELEKQIVSKLWRARNHGLQTMEEVCQFPQGYGNSRKRFDHREDRQQWQLRAEQLPLGDAKGSGEQSSQEAVEVYDLLNCGSRRAFTVVDASGNLLLVHNCFQFNPQHKGDEVGPFISWPFQDEAIYEIISCIEEGEDCRIEKSREMGATWVCLLVMLWYCLFHKWKKFLLTSRDKDAVDKSSDSDSLMWKIMFAIEWCPAWMTIGHKKKEMGIDFEVTKCNITGEAATGKAGVGGRYTAAFMDEFSQNPRADEVFARTADSTKCRIFNFTHVGVDTMAYRICFDEQYCTNMRSIMMHWTSHPEKRPGAYRFDAEKNDVVFLDPAYKYDPDYRFCMDGRPVGGPFPGVRSPWYDAECRRRPARAVAMDLDIDPRGATRQFYDTIVIAELKNKYTRDPDWVGELKYDPETARPIELIPNPQGKLKLWVHPKSATEVPFVKGAAGSDVAWGTGATPTCFSLMDAHTGCKIVEYANAHIFPHDAANYFVALCKLFKTKGGTGAKFCWEMHGPGIVLGRRVIELGYMNIYFRNDEDSVGGVRNSKLLPGWVPNPRAIMALHSDYWDALREKKYLNPSWDALDECTNFVFTSGSIEYRGKRLADTDDLSAARVHHGDITIADALSWKMGKEDWRPQVEEVSTLTVADLRTFAGRMAIAESYDAFEHDPLAWDE